MKTQHTVNQQQYAEKSNNYLNSAVHENGAEFAKIKQVLQQNPSSDVLDLGCGAGHVSYHVEPYAKKVIAYDLSKEMVALVKNQAEKKEINNIETVQGSA